MMIFLAMTENIRMKYWKILITLLVIK